MAVIRVENKKNEDAFGTKGNDTIYGDNRIFVLLVFNSNDGHLKSSTENANPKFANFDAPLLFKP